MNKRALLRRLRRSPAYELDRGEGREVPRSEKRRLVTLRVDVAVSPSALDASLGSKRICDHVYGHWRYVCFRMRLDRMPAEARKIEALSRTLAIRVMRGEPSQDLTPCRDFPLCSGSCLIGEQ